MVFVVFSTDGKHDVQLVPDTVYRIGRKLGVEFYIDDESIELVHAWIGVRADGIVRLSAVAGKTYVKERETEAVSISESDTVDDLVMLRFGNIRANLCFKRELEAETIPDDGGYDIELKSKSSNTTPDISFISSTNTSVDGESFFIPETQAVSFIKTSNGNDTTNISLDEDLLIPETQDILITNPAIQYQHNVNDTSCKDDESDLGTQVRICTQDFHEMDIDAIDDFDSSLLINDDRRKANKPSMQAEEKARTDPEKIVLNLWTTPKHTITELEDVPCTPDFLNVLHTLGTPDDTPVEAVENSEDYIETQVFSMGKLSYENSNVQDIITTQKFDSFKNKQRSDFDINNEDFIETQVFPGERMRLSRQIDVTNNPQDFIETSEFENQIFKPTPKETHHTVLNVNALIHTTVEDMIETQVFIRPAENHIITHSDSININDELDKDLKKLIDISSMPSSPSDVEEYNKRLTIINEQKNHLVGDKLNGNIYSQEEVINLVKKRAEEVDKNKHIRAENKYPVRVVKTHRKRSILQDSVTSEACQKNKKREVKDVLRLPVVESSTQSSKKLTSDAGCKTELSRLDFLKDVNAYLKKIKKSGRRIQLTLSRCNLDELQTTLFSLQNAFEVADKPEKCDVLIMDKGERTIKFLLGVASSKPLLSSRWLISVKETRSIDVKPEHIFNDDKFERIYKFEPLYIMNKPYLLKGLNFLLGSSIQPSAKDMKVIIQSAGGSVHSKAALITNKAPIYVVVEQQDKHFEKQLRNNNNVRYIKTEAIMQALVQRRVDQLDERKFQLPMKNSY